MQRVFKRLFVAGLIIAAAAMILTAFAIDNSTKVFTPMVKLQRTTATLNVTETLNAELSVESAPETEPEAVAVEAVPEPTYSEDDLFCLAAVIYQEAGADRCEDSTRIAIGNVVLNRVADSRFPDTIRGVLEQPKQWGRMSKTGVIFPARASADMERHAVERAYDCARRVLEGERAVSEGVVWAAEFKQGTRVELKQDDFYFCV